MGAVFASLCAQEKQKLLDAFKTPTIAPILLAGGKSMALPGTDQHLDLALLCDIPFCFRLAVKVLAVTGKREATFGDLEEHVVKVQLAEVLDDCFAPQERDAWLAACGPLAQPDGPGALTSRTGVDLWGFAASTLRPAKSLATMWLQIRLVLTPIWVHPTQKAT